MIDRKKLSLDKQVDTIVALNNPADHCNIMFNAKIDAELGRHSSVDLLPYPGSSLRIDRAKYSWALFITLLLQYMVNAPPQIINMIGYNKGAPF